MKRVFFRWRCFVLMFPFNQQTFKQTKDDSMWLSAILKMDSLSCLNMDSISLLTVLVRIVCCSHSPYLPLHLNPHPHSSLLSPHHHLHTQHTDFWLSSKIFRYKYNTAWATPCFAILQSVCRIMVTLARTRICIFIIFLIRKFLY